MILFDYFYCHFDFRWGRCYRVHGQFQRYSLFLPVDLVSLSHAFFCNMESQAFEVYSFSAFRFDFYTLLLYCVCSNCESFKSTQIKSSSNLL